MRFETKFDRWIIVLLAVAGVGTGIIVPMVRLARNGPPSGPAWLMFLPLGIFLFFLACTLPQYYQTRGDGLFLRQGWRRNLIPYDALLEVRPVSDSRSAAVFSTDRILIVTNTGKRHLIAVAEEERFLEELSNRCPQLEERDSGLGLPFSATTIGD